MMLYEARIRYRFGQTGYKKLIFNWLYDWHDEWNERDIAWRVEELADLLKREANTCR